MKKLVFEPYHLKIGDRILITDGPWKGDWDIIELSDKKIKVKCPFKGTELEWKRQMFTFQGEKEMQ